MNTKRALIAGLLCCLVMVPLLANCGAAPTAEPTKVPAAEPAKALRVAMVLPGPISDRGYNQRAYEGLMMIKEQMGAEVAFSESTPVADFDAVFRKFAEQGYDLIIGHGFEFGDVELRIAPDFPNIKFVAGGNPDVSAANVAGVTGANWDTAYVCGVLAGLMTKTGQIGAIGGFDFPTIVAQMENYKLGAQSVRPDVKITIVYIGSFDDVSKGKEAALAQASTGADVIFHIADAAGVGVIQAAEQEGVYAIGYSTDQNEIAPKTVITSLLYDSAVQYVLEAKAAQDGTWVGKPRLYTIGSGVTDIADFHGLVPDDVAKQVMKARDDIASGAFKPPYITQPSQ